MFHSARKWLYRQLFPEGYSGDGLSPMNKIITGTIIVALSITVLGTEDDIRESFGTTYLWFDLIFGIFFTLEYIARFWTVKENPRYSGRGGRLRYAKTLFASIDLAAILPFWLALATADMFLLRFLRLLRILTLAKLGRYSDAMENIFLAFKQRRYELFMSLFAAFFVVLISATVLYVTEKEYNPESFGSIPRALWWGAATITSVGYGGALPTTILGKIFATFLAIGAVGTIALPTGILAASFGDAFRQEKEKRIETDP